MSDDVSQLTQAKVELRKTLRQTLLAMAHDEREQLSLQLVSHLEKFFSKRKFSNYGKSKKILAFYPLKRLEPNIYSLLFSPEGKSTGVLLPRIEGREIIPSVVSNEAQLVRSSLGTLDPPESAFPVPLEAIEAVLVPALGFSQTGQRLGRGGGFYDRFLSQLPKTTQRIGVCFGCQILPNLPEETHDERVQILVTESGVKQVGG